MNKLLKRLAISRANISRVMADPVTNKRYFLLLCRDIRAGRNEGCEGIIDANDSMNRYCMRSNRILQESRSVR